MSSNLGKITPIHFRQTGIPKTKSNANERGRLPKKAARGLYESMRRPKNEKAPNMNPYATLARNILDTNRWYMS